MEGVGLLFASSKVSENVNCIILRPSLECMIVLEKIKFN